MRHRALLEQVHLEFRRLNTSNHMQTVEMPTYISEVEETWSTFNASLLGLNVVVLKQGSLGCHSYPVIVI